MALLLCDGFDSYSVTADLTKKWASATSEFTFGATSGRTGGGGLVCTQNVNNHLLTSSTQVFGPNGFTGTAATHWYAFAFWFKSSAAPSAARALLQTVNAAGTANVIAQINATGGIQLVNASAVTVNVASSGNVCDGNWHWIEGKYSITNGGNNSMSLTVDNVTLTGPAQNYGSSIVNNAVAFFASNLFSYQIDDFVFYDDNGNVPLAGTSFPLGPQLISTIRPASDSAVNFATVVGGTGTHASALSETVGDGDTSYVQDNTSGDQDLYGYGALSYTPASIAGVMANAYAESPNPGAINFKQICKNSATQTDGTSTNLVGPYATYQQEFGVNPNGGGAWTATTLATALFGVKIP
jgi:hypothetical protein